TPSASPCSGSEQAPECGENQEGHSREVSHFLYLPAPDDLRIQPRPGAPTRTECSGRPELAAGSAAAVCRDRTRACRVCQRAERVRTVGEDPTGTGGVSRLHLRGGPCSGSGRCGDTAASGCPDRKSTRLNSSHVKISYAVC